MGCYRGHCLEPYNLRLNAGDMPIALMFDGPSLGGFVCPATITSSDLWKLGQLRAGDGVQFKQTTLGKLSKLSNQYANIWLVYVGRTPCLLWKMGQPRARVGVQFKHTTMGRLSELSSKGATGQPYWSTKS